MSREQKQNAEAKEMAQLLRLLAALAGLGFTSQHLHGWEQLSVILVPGGNLKPSSGLLENCTHYT